MENGVLRVVTRRYILSELPVNTRLNVFNLIHYHIPVYPFARDGLDLRLP